MARFFIDPSQIEEDLVHVSGEEAKHALKVLRLGKGDALTLLDGTGLAYDAAVEQTDKDAFTARIVHTYQSPTEPRTRVTLYQGLCKADKMEWIIQKCIEAGIYRIVPIVTEHCVAREGSDNKQVRWQRIAKEAAKQSGRGIIPQVAEVMPMDEAVLEMARNEAIYLLWEQEKARGLDASSAGPRPASAALVIGPEGGISQAEAEDLKAAGAISLSLGPRILRTETAGLVALSALMCCWGEMQP